MKTRLISIFFLGLTSTGALAASIDSDCKPKGVIAIAKEAWNPKTFWTGQLIEIQAHVEGQKTSYRLSVIERRRDRINAGLDAEEARTLGILKNHDPALERALADSDRIMEALARKMLQSSVTWGNKCTAYAKQKLSQ